MTERMIPEEKVREARAKHIGLAPVFDALLAEARPVGDGELREALDTLERAIEVVRYERWENDPRHSRRFALISDMAAPLRKHRSSNVVLDALSEDHSQ